MGQGCPYCACISTCVGGGVLETTTIKFVILNLGSHCIEHFHLKFIAVDYDYETIMKLVQSERLLHLIEIKRIQHFFTELINHSLVENMGYIFKAINELIILPCFNVTCADSVGKK